MTLVKAIIYILNIFSVTVNETMNCILELTVVLFKFVHAYGASVAHVICMNNLKSSVQNMCT